MNSLGKAVRLRRLQNPASGRILTVALDHAPSYGLLAGLENIREVVEQVANAGPDAIMLMKGPAGACFPPYAGRIALILKCSTLSPLHPELDVWVSPVEEAVRLGADAIAMAVTIGSPYQAQILSNLAALVREAERAGMPVIAHAYPNGEMIPPEERFSPERVGYAARLAMELGVDIVKTFYTGASETFAQVVDRAAPALVVAAGGPKLDTEAQALQMAYDVVKARAAGLTFGRNIWQSRRIGRMIRALKLIVHRDCTVQEALVSLDTDEQSDRASLESGCRSPQ
ncbi:MAG TPA: 2-amino-3,7-dideoxy-D-threo-hept-6-ulosonate synthase [Terriglobia bacterium]|nr:2-amino-3,7-dideoxy-D-threo-hept-6-ulosonate synthase [Terriglobia bacterium]